MKKCLFLLVLMVSGSVAAQSNFDDTPTKKNKKAQTSVNNKVTEPQSTQPAQEEIIGYEYFDVELGEFVYVDNEGNYFIQNEDDYDYDYDYDDYYGYEYFDVELGEFVWVDNIDNYETQNQNNDSVAPEINLYKNIFNLPKDLYEVEVRGKYIHFLNSNINGIINIYELDDGFYTVYITKNSIIFKKIKN